MKRFDVIVSGGGMIGSIAAVAANHVGLSVLLIESNKKPHLEPDSARELRVSAISANNISYLKQLNVFQKLLQSRIQDYHHMQVWDNRSNGQIKFDTDYSQHNCLGYLIENNNLVQAAWEQLEQGDDFLTLQESSIKELENDGAQVRVELINGQIYKSRLLIAAEGRNSFVRQTIGVNIKEKPYNQKGLVAYIKIPQASKETAFQAFNDGGPIGVLPLNNQESVFSVVWSLPIDKCNHWLNCEKHEFETGIKQAIGQDSWSIELISQRAAFPLTQLYANEYFKNRIVLCGDTAHGVHPLAGQGVNLGIGDIKQLFQSIDIKALKNDDLLFLALRKYQRRRISQVKETSEMMTFLHELFKDDQFVKKPLRNLGLNFINQMPFKKWFVNQAGS